MLCKYSWKAHLYLGKHEEERQSVSSCGGAMVATEADRLRRIHPESRENKIYEERAREIRRIGKPHPTTQMARDNGIYDQAPGHPGVACI